MDEGQLKEPQSRSIQARRRIGLGTVAFIISPLALGATIWLYNHSFWQESSWRGVVGFLILNALLTLALERTLTVTPFRRDWRYRSAFMISAGIPVSYIIWELVSQSHSASWFNLGSAVLGAFLGGLLATALNECLWEDNSPPSESIRHEVHQLHVEVIGATQPEPRLKRAFDIVLALLGLFVSTPVWLASAFLIWIEDPGPLLFVKNSVGRGGVNFHQFKLRTMVREAENNTGPVLATEKDKRVLAVGRFLRKTALDELPQLINILLGEMSFVGPRPQRTVLVRDYLEEIPEYAERHRVLPGLAGLAQVAGDYYLTPRQKLRFDRLYIRHQSLGFDLKLIFLAFAIAFWFRWQENWMGRLPPKWLRQR